MAERIREIDVPVIGAILLASDLTTERDIRALVPPEIPVCVTRIPFDNPTTPENLKKTLPHLSTAASLLVPGVVLSAVYFSCTSASIVLGLDIIRSAIARSRPGVAVVTPIAAALHAFRVLNAKCIGVMTPYVSPTHAVIVDQLTANGMDICVDHAMEMEDDRDMAVVGRDEILEAALKAVTPECQALFISCTALPAARHVPFLESQLGIPVVTSNLAGLWYALRLAGVTARGTHDGTLMAIGNLDEAA